MHPKPESVFARTWPRTDHNAAVSHSHGELRCASSPARSSLVRARRSSKVCANEHPQTHPQTHPRASTQHTSIGTGRPCRPVPRQSGTGAALPPEAAPTPQPAPARAAAPARACSRQTQAAWHAVAGPGRHTTMPRLRARLRPAPRHRHAPRAPHLVVLGDQDVRVAAFRAAVRG